jgi:ADP-ribose pyrophosphatase YjhB (NUDIX family)
VKSLHDRISLLEHDLRANAMRLSRRKPVSTFLDHALMSHPQLAVSAAIFRDDKILLVRRARAPAKGFYSLPGGRVEFGESLHAALHREVEEETGLRIEVVDLAAWREALPGNAGGGHYLIMSFAARWIGGEPVLNEELDDFKWLAPDALGDLKLTSGLQEVIRSAWRLIRT